MKFLFVVSIVSLAVAACSKDADSIATAYVSPVMYSNYDCEQLSMEQIAIVQRATAMGASVDKDATNDAIATGVSLVLFWPAAFFIGGNDDVKQVELSQLKGKLEAVQSAMVVKKCQLKAE